MSQHLLKHHYGGYRPSLPDIRDHVADTASLKVLPEVDPRGKYMTPVYNQGQLGSCTANAVAAAVDADRIVDGLDPIYPARLAIYWLERHLEGAPADQDTGAVGRDGLKACRNYGILPEKDWPYADSTSAALFSRDPRPKLIAEKPRLKLTDAYKSVPQNITAIKQVLSNRQTIAFGFTVYESFESDEVARTGVMPVPTRGEQVLGGHEVLAVGYLKAEPKYALVRNSWDTTWGIDGYFLMPWAVLTNPKMTSDLRTIYRSA